jgi:ankyrin repeat protein
MATEPPLVRLVAASSEGLLDQVRSLLEGNKFDEDDLLSGLHEAILNGHADVVREYLKRGASTNAVFKGRSLLVHACVYGQPEVVQLLLESGADVSTDDQSPLVSVIDLGSSSSVDFVRSRKSTFKLEGVLLHNDPLPSTWNEAEIKRRCIAIVELLLKFGARTDVTGFFGNTPLFKACSKGMTEVVRLLVKSGCDVEVGDQRLGVSPLYVSCEKGFAEIVKVLIENGANVRRKEAEYHLETPLHAASKNNHVEVANQLIAAGANVNAYDEDRITPLMTASRAGHVQIARLLLRSAARINEYSSDMFTALHLAGTEGQVEMIEFLVANGASLDATDKQGRSPLNFALYWKKRAAAELLCRLGGDVNRADDTGMTAMHRACSNGDLNVVKGLVELGADVNTLDDNRRCPLHYASMKGKTKIVQHLLSHGAEVNERGPLGDTALILACAGGPKVKAATVEALLAKGADVNLKDQLGRSPLQATRRFRRRDIEVLLVKYGAKEIEKD